MTDKEQRQKLRIVLQGVTGMRGSLRLIFAVSGSECVRVNGWVTFMSFFCVCVCVRAFNSMQPEHATKANRAGVDVSCSDIVSVYRSPGANR